ncbi:GGDEF domain-containing protein [Schlegelella sp. S2-27]|uniref:diguanylate cyclase n=1 Tax=Caldimonas mangrovi TaxID=2944811 RepID=A0ABT0YS78_9BURK|nr:GGDEF domain-containing protein [Caldimonas mangrovi]MCM5681269.1 GGDEF domain-containing protein [Caldimonas mangrovi]
MPVLDPFTIGVVSVLFATAFSVSLLISRISLGASAIGMRTWLLGDAALIVSRYPTLAELQPAMLPASVDAMLLTNVCVAAGAAWHWLALRRHVSPHPKVGTGLAGGLAVGLLIALLSALLFDSAVDRQRLFHAVMVVLFAVKLKITWPHARRLWGARALTLAFAWALLANLVMLGTASDHKAGGHQWATMYLLMGTIMTLLAAMAFLLWLQQEAAESLAHRASTDALTGALNRHGVLPRLTAELRRASRSGRPVSIALCDLDHFKKVNDSHGHAVGDQVLKRFAELSVHILRTSDLVARWGGEEFLLVLPDTGGSDALIALERLRNAQAAATDDLPMVTLSAGIATAQGRPEVYQMDGLLQRADEQLYRAKSTRNSVRFEPIGAEPATA